MTIQERQEIVEAILNELYYRKYHEAIANGCNEKDAMTLADNWELYKDAQTLFKFYVDLAIVSKRFIKLESCDNLGDTFIRFDEKTPIEQWRRIDEMLDEEGLKVIAPNLNAR